MSRQRATAMARPGGLRLGSGVRQVRDLHLPYIPLFIMVSVAFLAVFGPFLMPYDPSQPFVGRPFVPPAWQEGGSSDFLLGTDKLGKDLVSKLIHGARVSAIVVMLGIPFSAAWGTFLALVSGFWGGKVDQAIMRFVDFYLAFPTILLALALIPILGPGLKTVIIVLVVTGWAGYTRIIRAEVLSLKERDYVALARVAGASNLRILVKHILPQVVNTLLVIATLQVGTIIIFEASLSFLGIGTTPPDTSWGQMLSEGRENISTAWWIAFFPGILIMMTALSGNLLGDWVRDRLDPKLRQI